jgi:GNAT superfamily N-acetyltransferase
MAVKKILSDQYTVRQARMEDLPRIHQLEQKKYLHYHGVPGFSLARLQNEYETPGFDVEKSVHLVEDQEGKLAALVEVWDESNPPVHPYAWMIVDPDLENQGLESYLLDWAEERSRRFWTGWIPNCEELCDLTQITRSNPPGMPCWQRA